MARAEADDSIRRLHHDIRNHLNAIKAMSGDNSAINEYLEALSDEMSESESLVRTGNRFIDSLLRIKLLTAREKQIRMTVYADFSSCDFIEKIDITSIVLSAI